MRKLSRGGCASAFGRPPAGPGPKTCCNNSGLALLSARFPFCAGHLKAIWPEIFGLVFPGLSAESDPGRRPRSPGPAPHIQPPTENRPRSPILRPHRGERKIKPDCLQAPSFCGIVGAFWPFSLICWGPLGNRPSQGSGRAPWVPKPATNFGGRGSPPFWLVFGAPRGRPDPKDRRFRSPPFGLRIGLRGSSFVQFDARGGPRRSKGVPGVGFGRKSQAGQAAFKYPAQQFLKRPQNDLKATGEHKIGLRRGVQLDLKNDRSKN